MIRWWFLDAVLRSKASSSVGPALSHSQFTLSDLVFLGLSPRGHRKIYTNVEKTDTEGFPSFLGYAVSSVPSSISLSPSHIQLVGLISAEVLFCCFTFRCTEECWCWERKGREVQSVCMPTLEEAVCWALALLWEGGVDRGVSGDMCSTCRPEAECHYYCGTRMSYDLPHVCRLDVLFQHVSSCQCCSPLC